MKTGLTIVLIYTIYRTAALVSGHGDKTDDYSSWQQWSSCSATCGHGVKTRRKISVDEDNTFGVPRTESQPCYIRSCPGYLGWPRIHFSGKIVIDANTVNNFRCSYYNPEFYPSELSKTYAGLDTKVKTHKYYEADVNNWNPDGSNQVYFVDTFVRSVCLGPNNCRTDAPIVGFPVRELTRGALAALSVDWQKSSEIFGMKLGIPGVLEGSLLAHAHQTERHRVEKYDLTQGYGISNMSRWQSKLTNITWNDIYYRNLFGQAKELTVTYVTDLFNQIIFMGRVTGTIGLTSSDLAVQVHNGRTFQPVGKTKKSDKSTAPFYLHEKEKILTLDLCLGIGGLQNGTIPSTKYKHLSIVAEMPKCHNCREKEWKVITTDGQIENHMGDNTDWYLINGGVIDLDLSHLPAHIIQGLASTRLAILNENGEVCLSEFPHGISYGYFDRPIFRLNEGESQVHTIFVSSFGKPLKNAQVNIYHVGGQRTFSHCGPEFEDCSNESLGEPVEALEISSDHEVIFTNHSGLATVKLTAASNPGSPRGCFLDGQVYPLQIFVRYGRDGKTLTFSDGEPFMSGSYHSADFTSNIFSTAAKVYTSVPEKKCPVWSDVRDTFIQYHNLYPVMWKNGIINLHSYGEIRKQARMLSVSMFETDFSDSRYMPVSRDLSRDRQKLIYNWIKCGMPKETLTSKKQASRSCTQNFVDRSVREVRSLVEKAIMLELTTIPPYMTAWFSLKTEFGRNMEIADVLSSVFVEEMLHMSLAGNVLSAIGGKVNLTDLRKLPLYPTMLASGESYQILPNVEVALGPFSIGLVDQIFSEIEKPSNAETKEIIKAIAYIWKFLYGSNSKMKSRNMQQLLKEINGTNEHLADGLTGKKKWEALLEYANGKISSISEESAKSVGGFYSIIALKLVELESCMHINKKLNIKGYKGAKTNTLFTGEITHQLNMSQWYEKNSDSILEVADFTAAQRIMTSSRRHENLRRPPLFEVVDLGSALEAIVEIVYQGEGGSSCSPFVTEPDVYASDQGREARHELSHFYRFQEIVHGRKLIRVPKSSPFSQDCIDFSSLSSTCSGFTNSSFRYCYAGDPMPFYSDGVWPMLFNAKKEYANSTLVHRINTQFSLLYTRMLFCLEIAFGGQPSKMQECMSIMYDMTMTGKRLARTPLSGTGSNATSTPTGAPTWTFVRDKSYRAGLPTV